MKRLLTILICLGLIAGVVYKLDFITDKLTVFVDNVKPIQIEEKNRYAKEVDYNFVQISKNFIPYNYQDLLNIVYTVLDAGYDKFTFYCPTEYEDCLDDVAKISDKSNSDMLPTIGNYVSPFNNFDTLKVQYDTAGEVTIIVDYQYSEEEIIKINQRLDSVWNEVVNRDMNNKDIIYAFHDYIINHTRYDETYEAEVKLGNPAHQANKASGPLFEGYAICSGYTDVMSLVLDRLNIPNFKVASESHVWNALYIDNTWYHIDLTWDDPVAEDRNINTLLHKFYLIDTKTLKQFDIKDHTFDTSLYTELNEKE